MNRSISYCLVISIIIVNIVFLGFPIQAEQQKQQIPIELKVTCNGLDKLLNSANKQAANTKHTSKNASNTGDILQLVGNMITTIDVALVVVAIILSLVGLGVFSSLKNARESLYNAEIKFQSLQQEIQNRASTLYEKSQESLYDTEINLQRLQQEIENNANTLYKKSEVSFRIQTDEIDLLSSKVMEKLDQTKVILNNLDNTNELTMIKISAIQNTLIRCLENAPDRNKAFSIYTKLLAAYEVLLKDPYQEITPILEEEMLIKATLIQGNKQYVPQDTIAFMKKEMNLPDSVLDVLWSDS